MTNSSVDSYTDFFYTDFIDIPSVLTSGSQTTAMNILEVLKTFK